jgi:hypothetical protein
MAIWKLIVAWVLVGAVVQLGNWIYARHRFGAHRAEVGFKASGVKWWMSLLNIPFWPLSVAILLIPIRILMRNPIFKQRAAMTQAAIEADAEHRCPDCGEPYDGEHEAHE